MVLSITFSMTTPAYAMLSEDSISGFDIQSFVNKLFPSTEYHELEVTTDGDTDLIKIKKDGAGVILERWDGEELITITPRGDFGASTKAGGGDTYISEGTDSDESFIVESVNGGVKIDILLMEKPDINIFSFDIDGWEDFDFFYQPSLQDEKLSEPEKEKLDYCTDTDCYDKEGKVFLSRPEHIVGSYAIYHKTKKNNQYKTGKAFHIERPKIVDAEGREIWAQLEFKEGVLSVITPQEFLDTATYPVRIDPTFGYTTIGASTQFQNDPSASKFTAPEDGTITSITSVAGTFANLDFAHAVYSDNSGTIDAFLASDPVNVPVSGTTATWYTSDVDLAITGGTVYWLAHWPSITGQAFERYDAGDTSQYAYSTGDTFENWPDPYTAAAFLDRMMSIYATYTATPPAPSGTNTVIKFMNGIRKFLGGKIIIR